MPEEPEIPLEHLQENIKDQLEEAREEGRREAEDVRPWPGLLRRARFVRLLALTTAVFAVLAAIASLASGNYSNEALFKANEATLRQNEATDAWAEYQADGIKRIQYANAANLLAGQNASQTAVQDAQSNSAREGNKQPGVMARAQALEQRSADLEAESKEQLDHHHRFAYSVTLFQVAIGLAALAALVNLEPLWWGSLLAGVAGIILFIYGFSPAHETPARVEPPTGSATPAALRIEPRLPPSPAALLSTGPPFTRLERARGPAGWD